MSYKRYRARIKVNSNNSTRWYYWRTDIIPPEGVERNTNEWWAFAWGKTEGRNLEGIEVIVQEHCNPSFKDSYRYLGLTHYKAVKFGDYIHKVDLDIIECIGEFDHLNRKIK